MLRYCLDRCKSQEMPDKAVDDFLPVLKFVSGWFVTSKMTKELRNALFNDDDILFFDEDSANVTLGILSVHLNNINLDDVNFYDDGPETTIPVNLVACRNRLKQCKII